MFDYVIVCFSITLLDSCNRDLNYTKAYHQSPLASFQPPTVSQRSTENFLKNSTNTMSQVPTKPRTIITLPHLIGARNRTQQQQQQQQQPQQQQIVQAVNKTPIIIRERIEPTPVNASTTTAVTQQVNQQHRVSSSPSTNSSTQIYSSSSASSSPASSTSSQHSIPITISSKQSSGPPPPQLDPVSNNSTTITTVIPVITSNNGAEAPLKSLIQNKIVLNAGLLNSSNNFTYEINDPKAHGSIVSSPSHDTNMKINASPKFAVSLIYY